jgi:hypothetical protein
MTGGDNKVVFKCVYTTKKTFFYIYTYTKSIPRQLCKPRLDTNANIRRIYLARFRLLRRRGQPTW